MYELIEKRFSKAIKYYDNNALAQKEITSNLFNLLCNYYPIENAHKPNIIEFGCGTGNLSSLLCNYSPNSLVLNDLCKNYFNTVEEKLIGIQNIKNTQIEYKWEDASLLLEKLSQANSKFDLITSSSTIQWLSNPLKFLKDCKNILNPNAFIAVSTFGPDNFIEINSIEGTSLKYNNIEQIRQAVEQDYSLLYIKQETIQLIFNSPIDVLNHIKFTGVNCCESKIWTKSHLENFTKSYNKYKTEQGKYTLTYKPIYIIAKNDNNR